MSETQYPNSDDPHAYCSRAFKRHYRGTLGDKLFSTPKGKAFNLNILGNQTLRIPRVRMQVQTKSSKVKIKKSSNKSDSICEEKHIPNSPPVFNKKRMVLL